MIPADILTYVILCGLANPVKIVPFTVETVNSTSAFSLVVIQRTGGYLSAWLSVPNRL